MNRIFPYILLLGILPFVKASAQSECAKTLDSANYLFQQGIIEDIPNMLDSCIYDGLTNEQKITALKLVIMSYLIDDNQSGAETAMNTFLELFPNYEIRLGDPVEFVYLFESYRTYSIFSIGVLANVHVTVPFIQTPYTLGDFNLHKKINSNIEPAFKAGLNIGRYISKSLELESGIYYGKNIFTIEDNNFGFGKILLKETHDYLELPLLLNYDLSKGNFTPTLSIGGSGAYFISANGLPTVNYNTSANDLTGKAFKLEQQRAQFNFSAIAGIGLKYKNRSGSFIFRALYAHGIPTINKPKNRYDNETLLTEYYYIDSDFSINQIGIYVGYTYNFYKTEKFR